MGDRGKGGGGTSAGCVTTKGLHTGREKRWARGRKLYCKRTGNCLCDGGHGGGSGERRARDNKNNKQTIAKGDGEPRRRGRQGEERVGQSEEREKEEVKERERY